MVAHLDEVASAVGTTTPWKPTLVVMTSESAPSTVTLQHLCVVTLMTRNASPILVHVYIGLWACTRCCARWS